MKYSYLLLLAICFCFGSQGCACNKDVIDLTAKVSSVNSDGSTNTVDMAGCFGILVLMLLSYAAGATRDKATKVLWAVLFLIIFILPIIVLIPR